MMMALNRPGGDSCAVNKTVELAVDKLLDKNTAVRPPRSAMYCEPNGNYHIDTTRLRIGGKPVTL